MTKYGELTRSLLVYVNLHTIVCLLAYRNSHAYNQILTGAYRHVGYHILILKSDASSCLLLHANSYTYNQMSHEFMLQEVRILYSGTLANVINGASFSTVPE